jgi:hypothetical protein
MDLFSSLPEKHEQDSAESESVWHEFDAADGSYSQARASFNPVVH